MSARDGHLRLERKQKDMADKVKEGKVRCSFCHKTEDQVRKPVSYTHLDVYKRQPW